MHKFGLPQQTIIFILAWAVLAASSALGQTGVETPGPPAFVPFLGGTAAETITAPSAYCAYSGIYYAGAFGIRQITYDPSGRRSSGLDGALTVGLGLGNPGHGLQLSATVADVSNFTDIYGNAKWQLTPEGTSLPALAVGLENVFANVSERQAVRTPYVVASRTFWNRQRVLTGQPLFARTTLSVGYGGGRFGHQPFAALATSLSSRSQALLEHDRWGTSIGYSVAPLARQPGIVLTAIGMRLDNPRFRTYAGAVTYIWSQ